MLNQPIPELLKISDRIAVLPIIHGSADFSLAVKRWMLEFKFDVVAIPLPPSFREAVEQAVLELPKPSIVVQRSKPVFPSQADDLDDTLDDDYSASDADWNEVDFDDDYEEPETCSYVPIDPCQPVIMAIRAAMGEHVARQYIDLETDPFLPFATVMPDPYALRTVAPEKFAAAILPGIGRPPDAQTHDRIRFMAHRLLELEQQYERVLFVTSILYWPWIREAYNEFAVAPNDSRATKPELASDDEVLAPQSYDVDPRSLAFLFDEIPFITGLYERARAELEDDENLSIDGVKELLIAARQSYRDDLGNRARRITPMLLGQCLKYIRNLSLLHRRMRPDLATIVTAAKQIMGDQFAIHVVERARDYYSVVDVPPPLLDQPRVTLGIDMARLPSGDTFATVNRLPGPPRFWQSIHLNPRPTRSQKEQWAYRWNPFGQCSYPPEDEKIESFRSRVLDRAKQISGSDLARTEKFTTSVMDGIDIRDTLRHWYEKQIYVKVLPPVRGDMDACVMLFDSPADPRDYPWRATWFAEHRDESTLAFFATNFQDEMIGPGIALATYGGAMFLYPPVPIDDVWDDRRIDFASTLEERLVAAACLHSCSSQVALLSSLPPGGALRRIAKHLKKHLIHVPLGSFSDEQVQQLRMVHVLNGKDVRSYADDFIRKI